MNGFVQLLQKPYDVLMQGRSVVRFVITDYYPSLFFSSYIQQVKKEGYAVITLDITQKSSDIKAQIETSFLGMSQCYWLGNLDLLPSHKQQEWQQYIDAYQGPNMLLYASSAEAHKGTSLAVFTIPNQVDKKLFNMLYLFLIEKNALHEQHIDALFTKIETVDLDATCLLIHYFKVMGSRSKEFFEYWLPQLVISQKSLFSLSQHFFAKQAKHFMHAWYDIKNDYSEQFWIAYWSDQAWRAAFYCRYMQERKFADAKKIGYRLPFSFLQKDYRMLKGIDLLNFHQLLYEFDFNVKNGGNVMGLDMVLWSFFAPRP